MNVRFDDVVKVIKDASINIDVLGNKSGKENVSDRIVEAMKFAPYINGDKKPVLAQSTIFNYAKEQGLKLANVQLQHWHKGNKVPTGKATNTSTTAFTPVESDAGIHNMQRVADDEVVIKKSKITCFELLWSVITDAQKAEVAEKVADAAKQAVIDKAEAAAHEATKEMFAMFGEKPVSVSVVNTPVKKSKKHLQEETEQEISDFLTRMKEIITANEEVEQPGLQRLIELKGKGNQLAAELVEAFETSPEATTQA
ncbi:hypothetical protein LT980_13815 [Citrobacter portucalensis]|uniref:hypothetical protein n=1 Tax=Citrobacter portucalensis TaxID=1639133 RepID=UPI00202CAAE9|nr:hypothetical protein [Citrobacter portucalensis]URR11031.1 hypothetical protein LT980_13815 [Citrobacter portucalensis]